MTIDLGGLYSEARARIAGLVSAAGVDPGAPVPATPGWRVHDVVAHVTGVAADGTSGNMAGAPGTEWTAAQVARGAGKTIGEMLAEWETTGAMLAGFLSSPAGAAAGAAVMDVHAHEADLRHALGLPAALSGEFLAWAGEEMRQGFADGCTAAGLPAVHVDASDFEWFRGRLGRRTESEVMAYGWAADPAAYLDEFFIFGCAAASLGETPPQGDAA